MVYRILLILFYIVYVRKIWRWKWEGIHWREGEREFQGQHNATKIFLPLQYHFSISHNVNVVSSYSLQLINFPNITHMWHIKCVQHYHAVSRQQPLQTIWQVITRQPMPKHKSTYNAKYKDKINNYISSMQKKCLGNFSAYSFAQKTLLTSKKRR